jgi:zinc D-Ala-D-Ala dipeptidase
MQMIASSNLFFLTLLMLFFGCSSNKTDELYVVSDIEEYHHQVSQNPNMELVDLELHIDDLLFDIRYATPDNFTGEIIYTSPKAFLRRPVADALKKVQDSLSHYDLGLMVYDAYRPYAATVKFYEVYPDPDFVADPQFGSRHNRGCAVDVTLIERASGEEIPMPTDYDEFTERAHPEYMNFPEEVIANRSFLFDLMAHYGFTHYPTEWWHFDYEGWEDYPLMNLSFEEL